MCGWTDDGLYAQVDVSNNGIVVTEGGALMLVVDDEGAHLENLFDVLADLLERKAERQAESGFFMEIIVDPKVSWLSSFLLPTCNRSLVSL